MAAPMFGHAPLVLSIAGEELVICTYMRAEMPASRFRRNPIVHATHVDRQSFRAMESGSEVAKAQSIHQLISFSVRALEELADTVEPPFDAEMLALIDLADRVLPDPDQERDEDYEPEVDTEEVGNIPSGGGWCV